MLPIRIAGTGYYLPERRVTSSELEEQLQLSPGWIERVTGVRERRAAQNESSSEMAAAAAQIALENAGLQASDLDAIVGASAIPQQAIPCTAVYVQRQLKLGESGCACFDINSTCLSFYNALHTVAHMVAAGVYNTVLIFSSEITRLGLNPHEPESSVLFGDAAAAVIITRSQPSQRSALLHGAMRTYGKGSELTRILGGGSLHHPNNPTTTPEMNMFNMDGPGVFRMAIKQLGPFLNDFFEQIPWQRSEVDALVPHQASGFGLKQLSSRLGFTSEQVIINLATRGNCIAASTPLALAESVESGRIKRNDRVLLLGTGAGLSLSAIALIY